MIDPAAVVISLYLFAVLVAFALVIIGRLRPQQFAPLDELLHFILRHRITRISLFVTWWWAGWHFLMPGV